MQDWQNRRSKKEGTQRGRGALGRVRDLRPQGHGRSPGHRRQRVSNFLVFSHGYGGRALRRRAAGRQTRAASADAGRFGDDRSYLSVTTCKATMKAADALSRAQPGSRHAPQGLRRRRAGAGLAPSRGSGRGFPGGVWKTTIEARRKSETPVGSVGRPDYAAVGRCWTRKAADAGRSPRKR